MSRAGLAVKTSVLASVVSVSLTAFAAPAANSAARVVRVRIDGINHVGRRVHVPSAGLVAANGASYYYDGRPVSVPPGRYLVAADIPDRTISGQVVSSTLAVRSVQIQNSGVITVSGRHGRRLTVSLTGAQAKQTVLSAGVCLRGQIEIGAGGLGVAGQVRVVPFRSRAVWFGYFDELVADDGTSYLLAGSAGHGIPARPAYKQQAARLARVMLAVRGGVYPISAIYPAVTTGGVSSLCTSGRQWQQDGPFAVTDYRTPGRWTTSIEVDGPSQYHEGGMNLTRRYLAGRSYADIFGSAATGPRHDFPASDGRQISYFPGSFEDPVAGGGVACCTTSMVTLWLGHRLVKRQRLTNFNQNGFLATLRRKGSYTLTDSSTRWFKGAPNPPDLLSPRERLTWRFRAGPGGLHGWRNFPLTETVFRPQGLSLLNIAPASGTTRLVVRIDRAAVADVPAARYRLRVVRVWYSVDDGHAWRLLKLARGGSAYLADVPDPAKGFVALRSFVADVHGDQATETIYRAYAIGRTVLALP